MSQLAENVESYLSDKPGGGTAATWPLKQNTVRNLQNTEIRNLETCDFECARKIFYQ